MESRCVPRRRSGWAARILSLGVAGAGRARATRHEGFLRHARFRWAIVATVLSLAAIAGYVLADVKPRPGGGTWYGYTLGTIGALLILWLAALGVRKRNITQGKWSLKAWTSAHVYLGLALAIIGTLHTGFQFGWNIHTLAWALMMLVIASGLVGVVLYATLPGAMSRNRGEVTQAQMLGSIEAIDRQLALIAQPFEAGDAAAVRRSLEHSTIGGRLTSRLTGIHLRCGNRAALKAFAGRPDRLQLTTLLVRKDALIAQARRHALIKAWLEVWLYVHVPATIALIAALAAHIVSVFFYR